VIHFYEIVARERIIPNAGLGQCWWVNVFVGHAVTWSAWQVSFCWLVGAVVALNFQVYSEEVFKIALTQRNSGEFPKGLDCL